MPAWRRPPRLSWTGCWGRNDARPAGCAPRRRAIPAPGGSRRCWGAAAGMPTRCAIWCAIMPSRPWRCRMPYWSSTRPASSSRAPHPAGCSGNTPARQARSPTARSACSPPTCPIGATPSSIASSTCPGAGPTSRGAGVPPTCPTTCTSPPSRRSRSRCSGGRSRRACRSPGSPPTASEPALGPARPDPGGVGEVETALRQAGKGYVLGVAGTRPFWSWGEAPVAGTAEEIARGLPASGWVRLSAGDGTKGPRLYDWAYLELADLEAEEVGCPEPGTWTRGLLVRRSLSEASLAYFTTWCPAGTPLEVLVGVEGRRWAIEDAFETAKTELGLDHNETRSWHGWHRHVSLVMLAFALLAVIQHRANTTAPPPKSTPGRRCRRWSAGRSRKSAVSPTG